MLKKKVLGVLTGFLAMGMCFMNVDCAQAASVSWGVHAQPGNYATTNIVSIVNHGNGYIASCTSEGGNAAYKSVKILEYTNASCTNAVPLNKTVEFTSSGRSIAFKHLSMPAVDTAYMKVTLTYSNGTTASMSGNIVTNS